MTFKVPSVLFVCVHNAGKSQMAAAIMRARAGESIRVISGGTHPGTELNAEAQMAALEVDAVMTDEYPKEIDNDVFMSVDRIVIIGNEAKLEPKSGMAGTIETWLTPEPDESFGDKLARTRIVRDDIIRRVEALYEELTQ